MATQTTNFNLTKIALTDAPPDITVLNANWDKVDTELAKIPTKTSQLTNDSGFKTTDNNTTYTLTKSGNTITLTGSDNTTTQVTDSNTTYTLAKSGSNIQLKDGSGTVISTVTDSDTVPSSLPANGGTADKARTLIPVTTAGTGAAYTASVSGITALTAGVNFIMVTHTVSTSTTPTLNVNSLGAKNIKRRMSSISSSLQSGYSNGWLASGKAFHVVYDGSSWVVEDMTKPVAADLYGDVPVESGGTGASDAATARTNLGAAPAYSYGTTDLTAGTSALDTGKLHFVYE